tara:strand:- start:262 stop:531 length:270 start_codon:yes stop_codon:yes gene_type:complete
MREYEPHDIDDLLRQQSKDAFQIHKQFKAEFGMTLDEADKILAVMKSDSKELYHLRCLLNGVNTHTHEVTILNGKEKELIEARVKELES